MLFFVFFVFFVFYVAIPHLPNSYSSPARPSSPANMGTSAAMRLVLYWYPSGLRGADQAPGALTLTLSLEGEG
jgi:hypothetical protein